MKHISLLTLIAVVVTASLTLVFGNASLYAIVPSLFLLLIAAEDYSPKRQRVRVRTRLHNRQMETQTSSSQRLRLAA